MNALQAKDNIWWVGALDPDLRVFDIIMHTDYGTTYNSYLVKGSSKTVLFETVKARFFQEHLEKIQQVTDISKLDYIVVNHTEPDHAGSVAKVLELAPNATVLGSKTALDFLSQIINKPFRSQVVTENDNIDIGGMTLTFLNVPMLHWPDSMYTYIPEAKAVFTCDSFGCHYSDERVFNDLIDGDFTDAYKYYFDNIIGPFKNPFMLNALKKLEGLDIEFVGNGHGPVLRTDIQKYFDMYRQWSTPAPKEEKEAVICYVSAYGYTKELAQAIEQGLMRAGVRHIRSYDLVTDNAQEAKAAALEADGLLLGSPTILGDALPPVYSILEGMNPVLHGGKFAAAFGSYGWSGEAVGNLEGRMKPLRFKMPMEGLKIRFKPSDEQLAQAAVFGEQFGAAMLGKK